MGLVEALWMVDLLAGRAVAAQVDFILAGPTASYLSGRRARPGPPLLLVTSREYSSRLVDAVSISSRPARPRGVRGLSGLAWSGLLYGWPVAVLEDPQVSLPGLEASFEAREVARRAPVAVVNGRPVRLAPADLEEALEATGIAGDGAW